MQPSLLSRVFSAPVLRLRGKPRSTETIVHASRLVVKAFCSCPGRLRFRLRLSKDAPVPKKMQVCLFSIRCEFLVLILNGLQAQKLHFMKSVENSKKLQVIENKVFVVEMRCFHN